MGRLAEMFAHRSYTPGFALVWIEEVLTAWRRRRMSGQGQLIPLMGELPPPTPPFPGMGKPGEALPGPKPRNVPTEGTGSGGSGSPSPTPGGGNAPPKGGAGRASAYGSNWPKRSLQEAIDKFAPGAKGVPNAKGDKIIYANPDGKQVVYDPAGNYFRIEDTNLPGKRKYLDMNGNVPNNKIENGKQKGRTPAEYNEITHYANTD